MKATPFNPGLFVVLAVLAATICNALIAAAGWDVSRGYGVVPEGWAWVDRVVGYVWLGLFAAMGGAAWLAYTSGRPTAMRDGRLVLWLMALCLAYPLYTFGMREVPGLVGNAVVTAFALVAIWRTRRSSPLSATLLVPVAAWVSLATVYLAKLVAANA